MKVNYTQKKVELNLIKVPCSSRRKCFFHLYSDNRNIQAKKTRKLIDF